MYNFACWMTNDENGEEAKKKGASYVCLRSSHILCRTDWRINPLMPNGAFNICCPRDCVSRPA